MTISSIETSSPTASSTKIDFAAPPNEPNTRTENSEFGQIMSGVMQSSAEAKAMTAGQEVAVSLALQPGIPGSFGGNLGGDFLKAVNLGPYMNVITSEATVPDEQSLEAFARSQGLDETAVQWLMGSGPASLSEIRTDSTTVAADAMGSVELPEVPTALHSVATPSIGTDDNDTVSINIIVNKPEVALVANALTAAALWTMTQATEKARITSPAQEDPSEAAKIQINLMASPAPAAFWMLRNPMVTAPNKEPVATPSGVSSSEIDLTKIATPDLLDSLSQAMAEGATLNTSAAPGDHPTPLSGHSGHRMELAAAARQEAQNPDASASAPDSGNAQRSENVQNLAEKMGQAVGQRILSEIEKGQWHLKLSLRPATLGHIEVEMRMRSGELDAIFTAPQAMTRELLQEGMSKLKDTLNQMGMDVASMQVGDGQTQKRGGESTSGQTSKSTNTNSDDSKSSLSNDPTPVSRMKMGQDGWDVLV